MSLWRRIRTLWWLSGQDFDAQPERSLIGNMLARKSATIVDTSNALDNFPIT